MPSMLLFSGLPLDVRETDLAELLTSEPTRLLPSSVAVTALYNSTNVFLGTFLVQVGTDADAEKVRKHYSGQIIDGSHHLAVHHVLAQNMPHPSVAPPAPAPAVKHMPTTQQQQPAHAQATRPPRRQVQDQELAKAPGLKLLGRMNKTGKTGEKEKQKLLLDKQRAAVRKAKGGNPGDMLLSRLKGKAAPAAKKGAAPAKGPVAAKGRKGAAGGKDKVTRAKKDAGGRMDVDKAPAPAPAAATQAKPKTQAQLDEEMKAYERQRRFAAA